MLKVLFFGTPQVAVPFLQRSLERANVVGVVCRPDEPVGRGLTLTPPPTKVLALQRNISVFQPVGPWTPDFLASLRALNADLGVIVAYGRILPRDVFMAPAQGSINIHFSLLPKYRGAAPMQWSLISGEERTGVTAFWLEEGLDSGPICRQAETAVAETDNAVSLREKLISVGLDVLDQVLADAAAGAARREDQSGTPTLAPQLKKEDGRLDWGRSARDIVNLIRGVVEWPGAVTTFRSDGTVEKKLKVLRASAVPGRNKPAGEILSADAAGILVQASDAAVRLEEVQPEGKKAMNAWSFWQGARIKPGEKLGS